MKKILFTILLLAVASLGLALPQGKKTKDPSISTPAAPVSTTLPTPPTPVSKSPAKTPAAKTPASTSPLLSTLASPDAVGAVSNDLGVSASCAKALVSIVGSPEFLKCVPLTAFAPIIPIVTDPKFLQNLKSDPAGTFKKIEPAFVKFSDAFCPAPKCSDKGISGAIKIISDGCKDDLQKNAVIQLIFDATVFYSPLHDTVCFKSKKSKDYCWDESLTTIFSLPKSPIKIVDGGLVDSIAVADPTKICTTCNKDIVNTFQNFLKNNDLAKQILQGLGITDKDLQLSFVGIAVKCGIDFEDGKVPDKP